MLALLAGAALAADWLTLAGTEEGRPDEPVKVFGFVQPAFVGVVGGETLDGQVPVFNRVNNGGSAGFLVRRARLAARGSIPKTNQRVVYYLMTEAGENVLTRTSPVVLTDMSLTVSAPGARFRLGQFKLPVMEEIVQGVAPSMEFVQFSQTLTGLLLENPIQKGAYTGGGYGFRDVGVQVFEGFQHDHLAGSYAVMVSNGSGMHAANVDDALDVTARGEIAWVTSGERTDVRREEIKIGAWWSEGSRPLDDTRYRRMRRGAFVHVEQGFAWGLFEVAQGRGMLETGIAPPFPGGQVQIAPEGQGFGAVASAGVRIPVGDTSLGLKGRYDQYNRRTENAAAERVFRTGTAGVEWDPVKKVRVQVDYELRKLAAPGGDDAAKTVAAAMGDRVSAQITAMF